MPAFLMFLLTLLTFTGRHSRLGTRGEAEFGKRGAYYGKRNK